MNDKNKNGFGLFGAIAVGVVAIATAVVMVNKKKKSKNKYFLKEELVKLPVFRKEEPPKKKEIVEEEDIFEDEYAAPVEEKKSFFSDAEEVSYEEDEEFQSESHAKPIVTPVKPEPAEEPVVEEPVIEEPVAEEEVIEEPVAEEVIEEPVAEEVIEEPVAEEEVIEEPVAEEEVIEEPVAEEVVEEPVAEEVIEEPVAEEEVIEEPVAEDDTFVFESVVVGKQEEKDAEAAATEETVTEEIAEPVMAEPERATPVMKEETPVRNTYYNTPVIDELIRAAMEEVTGKSSGEKTIENTTETASDDTEETPVEESVEGITEESVEDNSSEETPDEIDEDDDDIRAHESYYDWIYNVDEHYSVITDGKWVYCKSDDILTSTSVNKKGGRETIDIAETFKNRINVDGYCLLKYIGTEKNVVIPSVINGKPVVAAMNTFRSNQVIKTVTIPSSILGLRRTFYSCYHLDKIIFEDGTRLLYELDSIMCGNNDMDSDTESTTVICSQEVADYLKGHYKLGCPVVFKVK